MNRTRTRAQSFDVRKLVLAAMLSALSFLLYQFVEFPVPFMPPWLKIDISLVPVLVGSFALGPVFGILIQLVKDLIGVLFSDTAGIGELADFLMGAVLILPAAIFYQRNRTRKYAMIGMSIGIVLMVIMGCVTNYYMLLPLYAGNAGYDGIIAGAAEKNSMIQSVGGYITYAVIPFNLLKGILVSAVTILIYKRISPLLRGRR